MATMDRSAVTALRSQELVRIKHGRGRRLAVFGGRVWVTQEGDARDVFLHGGESFRLDRDGMAVVEALSDARLALVPTSRDAARPGARPRRSAFAWASYLLALAAALTSTFYIAAQARTEAWEAVARIASVALR